MLNPYPEMSSPKRKQAVIVVAGGKGSRIGGELPKQFCKIGGKPMLMHTIEAFHRFDRTMLIVLVLPATHLDFWGEICREYNFEIPVVVANGGDTRFHSVKNGLGKIPGDYIVGVHDAARPFVSQAVIGESYRTAAEWQCGAVPVVDEKNSVRLETGGGSEALDRSKVKIVQTPQVFPANLLNAAYRADFRDEFTDDAAVAENAGIRIRLTKGDELNFKITTRLDMELANLLFRKSTE